MIALVTASDAEAAALVRGLTPLRVREGANLGPYPTRRGDGVLVIAGGIGPAAAAAASATVLANADVSAILSLGIAGGFAVPLGAVVVASRIVAADLGAHSPEGWLGHDQLGWPEQVPVEVAGADRLARRLGSALDQGDAGDQANRRGKGAQVRCGPILTVSAVTGTDERAAELAARHGALAEAMEGAGVAAAATRYGVPVGEVRVVSNVVGRRDRSSWDIQAALTALTRCAPILVEAWP